MIGLGSDKNIHIMTDKSNYSQHQVIFQSFGKVFCHTCNVLFCIFMLWSPPLEGLAGKIIEKANINVEIFTLLDAKMIKIWTFPADPSTKRVPSLVERVAYLK